MPAKALTLLGFTDLQRNDDCRVGNGDDSDYLIIDDRYMLLSVFQVNCKYWQREFVVSVLMTAYCEYMYIRVCRAA